MKKLIVCIISVCLILCFFIFAACENVKPPFNVIYPPSTEAPGTDPENPTLPGTPEEPEIPDVPDVPDVPENPNIPEIPEEPEPPANVIPAGDVMVKSNTKTNVRSGPGTNYSIVGSMDSQDMLSYIDLKNGWYEVQFKKGKGYVSAGNCTLVGMSVGSAKVEKVVAEGKKLMGLPYVYGAERYHWGNGVLNPKYNGKTYDCSSLTQYVFKVGANVNIATTSREQSVQGTAVSKSNLKKGDLMFFTNDSRNHLTGIERIGHVAMFMGDNYILHTASDYAVIEPISAKRWSYYINARRFV